MRVMMRQNSSSVITPSLFRSALSIISWIQLYSNCRSSSFSTLLKFLAVMQPMFSSSNSLNTFLKVSRERGANAQAVKISRKALKSIGRPLFVTSPTAISSDWLRKSTPKILKRFFSSNYERGIPLGSSLPEPEESSKSKASLSSSTSALVMPVGRQASALKTSQVGLRFPLFFIFKLYHHLNYDQFSIGQTQLDKNNSGQASSLHVYNNIEIKVMKSKRKLSTSNSSLHQALSSRKLLISKSPSSKSPAHADTLRLSQRQMRLGNVRKTSKEQIQEVLVQVSSDELYAELQAYAIAGLQRWKGEGGQQRKDLLIISKIQEFYQQYNSFCNCNHHHLMPTRWIILSNAVNGPEIQEEFNRTYEPITFYFLKDIQHIVNFINFTHSPYKTVTRALPFFSKIINFGNYSNQFACILEYNAKIELYKPQDNNELWLVSRPQLSRVNADGYKCCYLGQHSSKGGEIQLIQIQGQKMLYLLVLDEFEIYLNSVGIKQLEENIDESFLKQALFLHQEPIYYQKAISNYLTNEVILNFVDFPIKLLDAIQKQDGFFTRLNHPLALVRSRIYSVYYQRRDPQVKMGAVMRSNAFVKDQIKRIRTHFQTIANFQLQYEEIHAYITPILFAIFGIKDQQFVQQLQFFTKQTVIKVKQLLELNQYEAKSVILINNLTDLQRKYLSQNIVSVSFDGDSGATHEAVIKSIIKLSAFDMGSACVSVSSITNFSPEFRQLQQQQSRVYFQRSISDFPRFLSLVQKKSIHMVILEMEDYTQEREKQLEQTELLKDIIFEVYLHYGHEFIFRNKNVKYTFLKKDQLLGKIRNIIDTQHTLPDDELELNYQPGFNFHSDIQHNRSISQNQTYSTPNLYYFPPNKLSIIICVPKSVPHYTLLQRSLQKYSLLLYSNIKQVTEMVKYLPDDHFAVIIASQQSSQHANRHKNHEFIIVNELSEKTLRKEMDKIIIRFELGQKQGSIDKKCKTAPAMILYSHSDEKQAKVVSKMHQLFKNSKVMTITKKQFRAIKKAYSVSDNIQLYQIGKPEVAFAKRLKTPLEIFQVFMSPHIAQLQFTTERIQFSSKQLLLKSIIDKNKKTKIKRGELSLSRSLSPKGRSLMQKECFLSESGLVLLQSQAINKLMKRQKFSSCEQLISLCLFNLSRGSQLLAVIRENEFFDLKDEVNIYGNEIIWIVVVSDYGKCIIREANIIFCREEQFEHTLALVTEAYRAFKNSSFHIINNIPGLQLKQDHHDGQQRKIKVEINNYEPSYQHSINSQSPSNLCIYFNQKIKEFRLSKLASSFVFNTKTALLSFFHTVSDVEQAQTVQIVCDLHNKRFIEQTLKLIEEDKYLLITYEHTSELTSYSSPSKTIFILQKENCKITHTNMISVASEETPQHFSRRLKLFLMALRRAT